MRLCLVALLLIAGCVPSGAVTLPEKPQATLWAALADRVEAGKIASTDELVLIVVQLAKEDDLTPEQVKAFDGLRFSRENLTLTEANRGEIAKRVRELK